MMYIKNYKLLTILFILLLSFILRCAVLGRLSLWSDEIVTVTLARQEGPAAILQSLHKMDATRAPLHPFPLHGWIVLFGHSDLAARSLSVLFSLGSVVLIYRLGGQLYGRSVGLWAAWLMAISPLDVQDARDPDVFSAGLCHLFLLGIAPLLPALGGARQAGGFRPGGSPPSFTHTRWAG